MRKRDYDWITKPTIITYSLRELFLRESSYLSFLSPADLAILFLNLMNFGTVLCLLLVLNRVNVCIKLALFSLLNYRLSIISAQQYQC